MLLILIAIPVTLWRGWYLPIVGLAYPLLELPPPPQTH